MYNLEKMDKRLLIFGNLFRVYNRLQTKIDNVMEEITSKQWFVILALEMFEEPPTLKELAIKCDYSHQNTKQIVNKLKEKDFVKIVEDIEDKRAIRIVLTDKIKSWSKENEEVSRKFLEIMFSTLDNEEIKVLSNTLFKIYDQLGKTDEK